MPELQQIAGMHVDAVGAAVDLRDAQIDEIDQLFRQTAFLEDDIDATEGLVAFRGDLGVVDAIAHDETLSRWKDPHL